MGKELSIFILLFTLSQALVSIEVEFTSNAPSGNLIITGTITLPDANGVYPGVVLTHGSGSWDRDESYTINTFNYFAQPPIMPGCVPVSINIAPLKDIAEGLTQKGFAVLRYDKRGCNQPNNPNGYCTYTWCQIDPDNPHCYNESNLTETDFIEDIKNAAIFLSNYKNVNASNGITLAGHSEGATLIGYAGVQLPDIVNTLVLLMGSGLNYDSTVELEIMESNMAPIEQLVEVCVYEGNIVIYLALQQQISQLHKQLLSETQLNLNLRDKMYSNNTIIIGLLTAKFFYSLFQYLDQGNYRANIKQFKGRILVINSPQDPLITPANYKVLHLMLGLNTKAKIVEIPGLIHFMIPSDYTSPNVSPNLINTVLSFLEDK